MSDLPPPKPGTHFGVVGRFNGGLSHFSLHQIARRRLVVAQGEFDAHLRGYMAGWADAVKLHVRIG